jgi:hypothetical protein
MFIKNIIEEIHEVPCLQIPMTLRINKTEAIYMANKEQRILILESIMFVTLPIPISIRQSL